MNQYLVIPILLTGCAPADDHNLGQSSYQYVDLENSTGMRLVFDRRSGCVTELIIPAQSDTSQVVEWEYLPKGSDAEAAQPSVDTSSSANLPDRSDGQSPASTINFGDWACPKSLPKRSEVINQ